jgi:D-serine deaminase-like pyridoxal phosphate-dependent protein
MTSTIGESYSFSKSGFHDITYAFPITPDKIEAAVDLSNEVALKILVDNRTVINQLEKECKRVKQEVDVLMKIDCNYHRSGVNPDSRSSLDLAEAIQNHKHLHYLGVLTHAGHSYNAMSVDEVRQVAAEEQDSVLRFVDVLSDERRIESQVVSIGSTPTVMNAGGFKQGITEIGPGNYVFFDYTQVALQSCSLEDCALRVVASVVSSYDDRIIVDAGATALSSDSGPTHLDPDCGFGKVFVNFQESELADDTKITSLSQEHGKIKIGPDSPLRGIKPGEHIEILPNHTCLVSNLFDCFFISNKDKITDCWTINRDRFSSKDLNHV